MKKLEERKNLIRKTSIGNIGGLPPMDTSLNAEVTGSSQEDGFRIEKVTFEFRPNVLVTGNLYIPDSLQKSTGLARKTEGENCYGVEYRGSRLGSSQGCQCGIRKITGLL